MEKKTKYFIILLAAFFICIGVFYFQFNNDVATFMIINETEVSQNSSFSGILMDSYSYGVANKTITYEKPDGELVTTVTDENGEFTIKNVEYSGDKPYYTNFTFAGDGKYLGCVYEGNVSVI